MGILEYCLKTRSVYSQNNGKPPEAILLDVQQYTDLLSCDEFLTSFSPPVPPVIEEVTTTTKGLFGSDTTVSKKYDYNNPAYKKAMKAFINDNANFIKENPFGKIYGMRVELAE